MKIKKAFYLLTFTVFITLLIPTLVQKGMFLDGVTYGAISKNLANGIGSYAVPHYSKTLGAEFYGHPPMVFIIQSVFFKIFGDAFYTEKIFSFFIALLAVFGIWKCWELFSADEEQKDHGWLPILLGMTIPLVSWAFKNNLLENTMTAFIIFAIYFILKSLVSHKSIYILPAGILIILAFLSKGFVAFFPIGVPLLFGLVYKKVRGPALNFLYLLMALVALSFLGAIAFPGLKNNILHYLDEQLIPALTDKGEITTDNRFLILIKLLLELAFPLLLLIFFVARQWIREKKLGFLNNKRAWLFLLIALSASIPLIITLKQRKFYLLPSIPFYILGISFWVYPVLKVLIEQIPITALRWIHRGSYVILAGVLVFSIVRFGDYSRDRERLEDMYAISEAIPEGTVLSTTHRLWSDWLLVAHMSRIGYLSLDYVQQHDYYLLEKNSVIEDNILEHYRVMDLNLSGYIILKRVNSSHVSGN